ncbi:MAG: permease-like cell division protein FtsX, partial [Desulfatiglandales bacterium]
MGKVRTWTYHAKQALGNILGNRLMHTVSLGTMTISILLIGAFLLFYVNVTTWITQWGQSLSMSVYLKDGIDEVAKGGIEAMLRGLPNAEIQGFVSKDKAMMEMREALGVQAGLLDGLEKNPFPASFEIVFREKMEDPVEVQNLKVQLEKLEGVEEVQYSDQWIDRFESVIAILRLVGLIIGGLLCVAVLFIVANTIKLTIYSRREEIEILKIVGATDRYVKMPYLIEGLLQGLAGGLIALLVLGGLYALFSLRAVRLFGLPAMDMVFLGAQHVIFVLALSVLLGLTGS